MRRWIDVLFSDHTFCFSHISPPGPETNTSLDIKLQRLIMNNLCDPDLSKVTDCMEHALMARYPRTRYSAGWDAKLVWIPLSYTPTFVLDSVLKMMMPRPAHSV